MDGGQAYEPSFPDFTLRRTVAGGLVSLLLMVPLVVSPSTATPFRDPRGRTGCGAEAGRPKRAVTSRNL